VKESPSKKKPVKVTTGLASVRDIKRLAQVNEEAPVDNEDGHSIQISINKSRRNNQKQHY
jgi:hypothetical protein